MTLSLAVVTCRPKQACVGRHTLRPLSFLRRRRFHPGERKRSPETCLASTPTRAMPSASATVGFSLTDRIGLDEASVQAVTWAFHGPRVPHLHDAGRRPRDGPARRGVGDAGPAACRAHVAARCRARRVGGGDRRGPDGSGYGPERWRMSVCRRHAPARTREAVRRPTSRRRSNVGPTGSSATTTSRAGRLDAIGGAGPQVHGAGPHAARSRMSTPSR